MNSALVNRNKEKAEEIIINKPWEPDVNEQYWYVYNLNKSKLYNDIEGIGINSTYFDPDEFEVHQKRILNGNCFNSIEAANDFIHKCTKAELKKVLGITSNDYMTIEEINETMNDMQDICKTLSDHLKDVNKSLDNYKKYIKTNAYIDGFERCMNIFMHELRDYCYNDNRVKAAVRKAYNEISEYKKDNNYTDSIHYFDISNDEE